MTNTSALSLNTQNTHLNAHLNARFTPLPESSTQDLLTLAQGKNLLRFVAGELGVGQVLLLPAELVMEVLIAKSHTILPVPQMPEYVLGVYQWRGKPLWTVDLGQFLGLKPLSWQKCPTDQITSHGHGIGNGSDGHFILVLQQGAAALGLAITQVEDIVSYDLATMQSPEPQLFPPDLPENLYALTKGIFVQANEAKHLLLNADYLLQPELYIPMAA